MGKRNRVKRRDMPPEVAELVTRNPEVLRSWDLTAELANAGLPPKAAMRFLAPGMSTDAIEEMDDEVEAGLAFIMQETGCTRERALLTMIDFVNDPSRYPQWCPPIESEARDGESNRYPQ